MKIKLHHSFIAAMLFFSLASAQSRGMYFSGIVCKVGTKEDSAFLINTELKIWKASLKGKVRVYDNASNDNGFNVVMSKYSIQMSFKDSGLVRSSTSPYHVEMHAKDSFPVKSSTSFYKMVLMNNRNADTTYIMAISPMLIWTRGLYSFYYGPQVQDTSVMYRIALADYPALLAPKEMNRLKYFTLDQFSNTLRGKLSGDTVYRIARFTCDSNEYLPQSPYRNLLLWLSNGINDYRNPPKKWYRDKELFHRMSKFEVDKSFSHWDSTNAIEDPNRSGTFISAPLKIVGQPKSLLIYERWIPFTPTLIVYPYNQPAQRYIGYKREVLAYGMVVTTGSTLWITPEEFNQALLRDEFNFLPYEECLRAERYKTLQIDVPIW